MSEAFLLPNSGKRGTLNNPCSEITVKVLLNKPPQQNVVVLQLLLFYKSSRTDSRNEKELRRN